MTLRAVASALERMKAATLTQLSAELGTNPRELEPLLDFWEHRGNIRRCPDSLTGAWGSTCGSACGACPFAQRRPFAQRAAGPHAAAVVYEWVDRRGRRPTLPSRVTT